MNPADYKTVYELRVFRWPHWHADPVRTYRWRWLARLVGWWIRSTGHAGLAEVPPVVRLTECTERIGGVL